MNHETTRTEKEQKRKGETKANKGNASSTSPSSARLRPRLHQVLVPFPSDLPLLPLPALVLPLVISSFRAAATLAVLVLIAIPLLLPFVVLFQTHRVALGSLLLLPSLVVVQRLFLPSSRTLRPRTPSFLPSSLPPTRTLAPLPRPVRHPTRPFLRSPPPSKHLLPLLHDLSLLRARPVEQLVVAEDADVLFRRRVVRVRWQAWVGGRAVAGGLSGEEAGRRREEQVGEEGGRVGWRWGLFGEETGWDVWREEEGKRRQGSQFNEQRASGRWETRRTTRTTKRGNDSQFFM
ncbi:hypothetical protein BDY24DRAFT_382297 [Mrakia frigida]|uniref:uncharacterized protein n=1 Tax=Mrakia frigida TaxID=29902 RepID=UPI003FCBF47E